MIEVELENGTANVRDEELQCEICDVDLESVLQAQKHIADHTWQDKLGALVDYEAGNEQEARCRVCDYVGPKLTVNSHVSQSHYDSESFSVLAFGTADYYRLFREDDSTPE